MYNPNTKTQVMKQLMKTALAITALISWSVSNAQVSEADSLVLVGIYNEMGGVQWTDNTGWLTEDPVGTWHGVRLDDGRVTELFLDRNNLVGEIPVSIGQLSELTNLEMYINEISGEIPVEMAQLQKLERFIISKNSLSGTIPEEITLMTNLKELNVLSNDLIGPVPDLSPMQNLERLYLDQNDMPGEFPAWVLDMPQLVVLSIQRTGLTGELPSNLFTALPKLEVLRLASNQLTGDVATWMSDTTSLSDLELYSNQFTGKIPDGVFLDLGLMSIGNNDIEGLPDFSWLETPMTYCGVNGNKLNFEALRKLDSVTTYSEDRLIKGPQQPTLTQDTIIAQEGDEIVISAGCTDENDVYTWYKDGYEITDANSSELVIASFQESDAGRYDCTITNADFEFELKRHPVFIEAEAVSSVRGAFELDVTIAPNPTSGRISVTGAQWSQINVLDAYGHVLMSSRNEEPNLDQLAPGRYVVQVLGMSGEVMTGVVVKI